MSSSMPPVPPANRSPKGSGSEPEVPKETGKLEKAPNNADAQGRTGNTKVNTTNQGYQQDR
jgi:hypothetical protein